MSYSPTVYRASILTPRALARSSSASPRLESAAFLEGLLLARSSR